jgi:hypothetical protein
MHYAVRVLVLDTGDQKNSVGAGLLTGKPIFSPFMLVEAAVMLRHKHHIVAVPPEGAGDVPQ